MTGAARTVLRGLTWGHRRAIDPLRASAAAFARENPSISVEWDVRSLEAFEHQALRDAVVGYDYVVFDHPFIGTIAQAGIFAPLDDILGGANSAQYAGPSLDTYRWKGKLWGAPVDAATMNAIGRPDLLAFPWPENWDDVMALAADLRRKGLWIGLANGDHHGFLFAGSLMYNAGAPWHRGDGATLNFDAQTFEDALERLMSLRIFAHPDCEKWNSIRLHDAMTQADDIAYCPGTYGYATYGEADFGTRRLGFGPFPGTKAPHCAGTLIGGAAVGLTAHSRNVAAASAYLRHLIDPRVQIEIFGMNHGQPGVAAAWDDKQLDARFNGYYAAVGPTLRAAGVRPRFAGFGIFERAAGKITARCTAGEISIRDAARQVSELAEKTAAAMAAAV
jgi:multiple sugar transport system substrate-binding protein